MNARILKAPTLVATALVLILGQAFAGDRTVNCDDGDSLQKAIDAGAGSAAPIDIYVTGTCVENLLIGRDSVSILGNANTVIDGQVTVRGADNLTIRDLTITGAGNGINASVARIFMTNVHLVGNEDYGLALRHGGAIFMRDGSIAHNQGDIGLLIENGFGSLRNMEVFENAVDGIVVNENGSLTMIGGGVNFHGNGTGIMVNLSSALELEGVHVGFNQFAGVSLTMSSVAAINDSALNANGEFGLVLSENSSATVSGGGLAANGRHGAWAQSHSVLRIVDAEVYGNNEHGVVTETDGGLFIDGTSFIDGNWAEHQIVCVGKEASMEIGPDAHVGAWACDDPDF